MHRGRICPNGNMVAGKKMSLLHKIVRKLPNWTMPLVRSAYCRYKGIGDKNYAVRANLPPLPPPELRFHVGSVDREGYIRVGRQCAADLERALVSIGRDWHSFEKLLDFGCGCGRTLAWLAEKGPKLYGSDLHAGCIQWCRSNLPDSSFCLNDPAPPLEYGEEMFDLIFSLSVFTHLDESDQFNWLEELRRVTRPGAILLISTHGENCWNRLPMDDQVEIKNRGIFVKEAHALWGVFDKYFNTYHSYDYIRDRWQEHFSVLAHIPQGINNHQDLVILRRR